MTTQLATPLQIVESYFDIRLDRSGLKRLERSSDDEWIDFSKHYLATMDRDFEAQFLAGANDQDRSLRLYFEPRLAHAWDSAVRHSYTPTALLGVSPDVGLAREVSRDDVSRMLTPLKKHLLIADSIYLRDSFYYCFDMVAENTHRGRWRDDPNTVRLVADSIRRLKAWLPVLSELRALIESRAIVFMPYYLTPSFPFAGDSPALKESLQRLKVRAHPDAARGGAAPPRMDFDLDPEHLERERQRVLAKMGESTDGETGPGYFSETEVVGAWLNARLLGLDPVFPNRAMFDWAADLYFDEGPGPGELTSDLITMDILPFGKAEGIGLDDLLKLRKNEEVFAHVRSTVVDCQAFLEQEVGLDSSRQGVSAACDSFIRERLDGYERKSVVRFIDKHPVAGIAFSAALGAALLPVAPIAPVLPVIAGAVLTPQIALLAQRRHDPKRRAVSYLQALL
ncbi:hypothetical protein ACSMXN_23040 [Jatrophihabitans sp. DSM 45814]